jgi:hypothetical protein
VGQRFGSAAGVTGATVTAREDVALPLAALSFSVLGRATSGLARGAETTPRGKPRTGAGSTTK